MCMVNHTSTILYYDGRDTGPGRVPFPKSTAFNFTLSSPIPSSRYHMENSKWKKLLYVGIDRRRLGLMMMECNGNLPENPSLVSATRCHYFQIFVIKSATVMFQLTIPPSPSSTIFYHQYSGLLCC